MSERVRRAEDLMETTRTNMRRESYKTAQVYAILAVTEALLELCEVAGRVEAALERKN